MLCAGGPSPMAALSLPTKLAEESREHKGSLVPGGPASEQGHGGAGDPVSQSFSHNKLSLKATQLNCVIHDGQTCE